MSWEIIAIPLASMIASIVIWIYFRRSRSRKASRSAEYTPEHRPDTSWQEYASFKDGLKFEGMQPQKTIQYGKIRFAYDESGEKVFIQTGRIPQGKAIGYTDIASFEIFRDREAIDYRTLFPNSNGEPEYSGETCFDLRIVIQTEDGVKTVLPFIDAPAGYEYAYTCAAKAACEVTGVLEDILRKRQGFNKTP